MHLELKLKVHQKWSEWKGEGGTAILKEGKQVEKLLQITKELD